MTIDTPSIQRQVLAWLVAPLTAIAMPTRAPTATQRSTGRASAAALGGSGRSRMALTMLSRLTRHADTVTTTRVSSTPMA